MEQGFWLYGCWEREDPRVAELGDRLKVFKTKDPNQGVAARTNKTLEITY